MAASQRWWSYARVLVVPLLLWALVVALFWKPLQEWLGGGQAQRDSILREWIEESRDPVNANLSKVVAGYLNRVAEARAEGRAPQDDVPASVARQQVEEFLHMLATPLSKQYNGTLPLFLTVYRLSVCFREDGLAPINWEADLSDAGAEEQPFVLPLGQRAWVEVRYQMHAYDVRQREEALRGSRIRYLSGLAVLATLLAVAWVVSIQRRESRQQRQLFAAERRQQEAERDLLEQKLAAQQYEQKMLEMKSQLYASIGIMAGSYAHNIKNLLVRPNDLLRRCLEADGVAPEQTHMLQEVRHTLGTVTERLQQILQTVRRDPTKSEPTRLDLRLILRNLEQTWRDLAGERWKMQLVVEEPGEPLWIDGDESHLQQAVENLLFNARDATFEMRAHLREQARQSSATGRKQALIAAAGWKGKVTVRAWAEADEVVLELGDNGIGMSEEVRQRCTETHYSTKRDNALLEGHSTGMGLGLSFVKVVLDNHGARLAIDSTPLQGATFRFRFPACLSASGA